MGFKTDKLKMDTIKRLLSEIKPVKSVVHSYAAQRSMIENWEFIFGTLASEVKLDYLRDGILSVTTRNPIWQTELMYFKPMILGNVRKFVKGANITDIRVTFETDVPVPVKKVRLESPTQPLDELIRKDIAAKKAAGMALCDRCKSVYTADDRCVFCRAEHG